MSGVSKLVADKNQRILLELVSQPGNGTSSLIATKNSYASYGAYFTIVLTVDICEDCKSRAPRWASHNLGIFIWYAIYTV